MARRLALALALALAAALGCAGPGPAPPGRAGAPPESPDRGGEAPADVSPRPAPAPTVPGPAVALPEGPLGFADPPAEAIYRAAAERLAAPSLRGLRLADRALGALGPDRCADAPTRAALADLRERVADALRERLLSAAAAAEAAGDLAAAEAALREARPRLAGAERDRVAARLASIAEARFADLYREGASRYAVGEDAAALRAFLGAARYRPADAAPALGLFDPADPPVRAVLREAAPTPPALGVTGPARGARVELGGALVLRGRVDAALPVTVAVDGERVPVAADGAFRAGVAARPPGPRVVEVRARDLLGRTARITRAVQVVDRVAPSLQVLAPPLADGEAVVAAATVDLVVAIEDAAGAAEVSLSLEPPDGAPRRLGPWTVRSGERLRRAVALDVGRQTLVLRARDAAGNASVARLAVERAVGPAWFRALPPPERPPLPLPAGVAFGDAAGEYVAERDGSVLVWVPPGRFAMGSADGGADEAPVHEVAFAAGFFLGKHEVTWAQYERFAAATGRSAPSPKFEVSGDHPVHGVSWADAGAYAAWAGLRLPSEAEWEYAARGPDGRAFPWGDAPPDPTRLNDAGDDDGWARTAPVAAFPAGASPFGVLGQAGNVWEWVADAYVRSYAGAPTDGSARTGPDDAWRVTRGGCWNDSDPDFCRAAARDGSPPDSRGSLLGFRVAR